MASTKYSLDHFYYGQTVKDNQPEGTLRLLAATSNVTPQIVAAAVDKITLPPLPKSGNQAWALVRGSRSLPYLMVQSQTGDAGQIVSHYILIPSDTLRAMGGNIRALSKLLHDDMPVFTAEGKKIFGLSLEQPDPETSDEQVEDMLSLMDMTKNSMDTIEKLLSALVQNVKVAVNGAPDDLKQRIDFIEGVLSLLPESVRFAVTFTTHSLLTTDVDAQIRFYTGESAPPDSLVYDWDAARISGESGGDDEYSRFIISQLRLDTDVVIERTRTLTPTAGWRMKQGDKLNEALAYGSHRIKIDQSLLNGQPANKEDVSRILAEDPTLSDDMRLVYARHLMTLSLAMNDGQSAAPVARLFVRFWDLENSVYQQLTDAQNEQPQVVYDMVSEWLKTPEWNKTERWVTLAHRTLLAALGERARVRDIESLNATMDKLLVAEPEQQIDRISKKIVETVLPLTTSDAALAQHIFLFAAKTMDSTTFSNLMNKMKPFVAQLPVPLKQFWAILSGAQVNRPTDGLLLEAARAFGEKWEGLLVARFGEFARAAGRVDLLDVPAMSALAHLALSPEASAYQSRLIYIAHRPDSADLQKMGPQAAAYMLQIWLAVGNYDELVAQMLQQSGTFYSGDKQVDYIKVVEWLFAQTPLPSENIPRILAEINAKGLKSAPLLVASIGALQNRKRTRDLEQIAQQVEKGLNAQPNLLQVIPPDTILRLLTFYTNSNDTAGAVRVADLVSVASANQREGLAIITQMYKLMAQNPESRVIALDFLRLYVRQADESNARYALAYCGRELGANVRAALETTFTIKGMMGGQDIVTYAENIQAAVSFLHDTASVYSGRNVPTMADLNSNFNSMQGAFSREEKLVVSRSLMTVARAMVAMAQQKHSKDIAGLLAGRVNPVGVLDVLRIIAGYCAEGRRHELKMLPPSMLYPLGSRSRKFLYDEMVKTNAVIGEAARAMPTAKPVNMQAQEIRDEIDSLLHSLNTADARETKTLIATELQKLTDLIELIVQNGDVRAVEEGSSLAKKLDSLKVKPQSALEFYRFLYSYNS